MSELLSAADIQDMIERSHFHQLFKPTVLDADHDGPRLTVRYQMRTEFERQPGTNQWHGGAISAIVDTTGCYAFTMLAGELFPTISFRTDYLRPAIATDLTAVALVRRAGRSVGVVDVDVIDDDGKLAAVGRGSYSTKAASS
ncbi:MAG: PaaI family thioesterase [Hyphomicrobiaceae bacterium]